jgi:hypothetical protein
MRANNASGLYGAFEWAHGRAGGLMPYRKKVARHFIRQVQFGPPRSRAAQYAAIENLPTDEIFELRYTDLDLAIDRLRTPVREGR